MKGFLIFLSLVIFTNNLYSSSPWQLAVESYPENYVLGSVIMDEKVFNSDGDIEESSLFKTSVDLTGNITLLEVKYNNELVKKSELKKLQDEVNEFNSDNDLEFDPFDPEEQSYISYKEIESTESKTDYTFKYSRDELIIAGRAVVTATGIPLSCNFIITSLPIVTEEYTILELAVKNSYKKGKNTLWYLYRSAEVSAIQVSYFFVKLPFNVETTYFFNR